jgi:hypothetical protein
VTPGAEGLPNTRMGSPCAVELVPYVRHNPPIAEEAAKPRSRVWSFMKKKGGRLMRWTKTGWRWLLALRWPPTQQEEGGKERRWWVVTSEEWTVPRLHASDFKEVCTRDT